MDWIWICVFVFTGLLTVFFLLGGIFAIRQKITANISAKSKTVAKIVISFLLLMSICSLTAFILMKNSYRNSMAFLDYIGFTDADMESLKDRTNLEYLILSGNEISNISALRGLTNLEYLNLSGNEISDISALRGLTNLEYLILSGNEISDIDALRGLTNLVYLDLRGNEISDIDALRGLINLERLDLSNNQINEEQIEILRYYLPNCEIYY